MGWACDMYGGREEVPVWFWGGKTEGKIQLLRRRHRRKDNIKMDWQGVGWEGVEFVDLAQDSD